MTTPAMGWVPRSDRILPLPADGDYVLRLRRKSGDDYPDGFAAELRLFAVGVEPGVDEPTATWAATVSGDTATWEVDNTDVAAAIAAGVKSWRLHYTDEDGNDLLWEKGVTRVV